MSLALQRRTLLKAGALAALSGAFVGRVVTPARAAEDPALVGQ